MFIVLKFQKYKKTTNINKSLLLTLPVLCYPFSNHQTLNMHWHSNDIRKLPFDPSHQTTSLLHSITA